MRQQQLQDICEAIVDDVDGALGCSLVDLATGLPIALDVKQNSMLNATAMEMVSAAGATYFRERLSSPWVATQQDADRAPESVQEIQTTTKETYHFMSLVFGEASELFVLVTERKSTNLGLGWISVRHALRLLNDAFSDDEPQSDEHRDDGRNLSPTSPPVRPNQDLVNANVGGRRRTSRRRTIWHQR
ncbi:MAG: hypothetical protein OXJ53_21250 [Gammaproteobacteria bacterium]|nr:hypothetical protein [Gammaproteobacteria bacterium]